MVQFIFMEKPSLSHQRFLLSVIGLLTLSLGTFSYFYYTLRTQKNNIEATNAQVIAELEAKLASTTETNLLLEQKLRGTEQTVNDFATTISSISGTVGTLQKLSETDPELLKKYSKVFFLSENYIPSSLTTIDPVYVFEKGKIIQAQGQVYPYLQGLLALATSSGIDLRVVSGYRSFNTQESLKSTYRMTYGSGTANKFSAEQGYSEHQLGSAFDFTTPKIGGSFVGFGKSTAFTWLQNNAHLFGFVLSYPEKNMYYTYEPWHWRFVGVELATKLYTEKKYFYDLDQREIDMYLIKLFD